jgi:hypothetical protein
VGVVAIATAAAVAVVAPDSTSQGVDGIVVDASGKPAGSIPLNVRPDDDREKMLRTSGADGTFRLRLAPGDYEVWASVDETTRTPVVRVHVTRGTFATARLVLPPGAVLPQPKS